MTELGKHGKLKGALHPKHERRIDHEPSLPTPAAKPHRKPLKPFGIAYERQWPGFHGRQLRFTWGAAKVRWFETERQRDQALADALKKASRFERNHEKVRR